MRFILSLLLLVNLSGVAFGQARATYDKMSRLRDTNFTSIADDDIITYDLASGKWINESTGEASLVTGPASSTDNAIARFDGATGTLLQNSGVTISDAGDMSFNEGNITGLTSIDADSSSLAFNFDSLIDVSSIVMIGDLFLNGDNDDVIFGSSQDASIGYDGTNLVINPRLVGSGSVTIGAGAAGVDYVLSFDGESGDGTITFDEDNSRFDINNDVQIGTNKTLVVSETGAGDTIRIQHLGTVDYLSANETGGTNSNIIFADIQGDYNWGLHVNVSSTGANSKAFVGGAHATDSKVIFADVDATGASILSGYQANTASDGTQNLIELFAAQDWQDGNTVGRTFDGDFFEFQNAGNLRARLDADGLLRLYETAGTKNVRLEHDGTNGILRTSSGALALTSGSGVIHFLGVDGTNNEQLIWDMETVANRPIVSSGTGVTDIFWGVGMDMQSDVNFWYGTSKEWSLMYNDAVDDQLLLQTAKTGSAAVTDPMFEVLVDTGLAGGVPSSQQLFGVAVGSQASNTPKFTVDEDGDGFFSRNLDLGVSNGEETTFTMWSDTTKRGLIFHDGLTFTIDGSVATQYFQFGDSGTPVFRDIRFIKSSSSGDIAFMITSTEIMTITDDQNIGITDSTPNQGKLDIDNTTGSDAQYNGIDLTHTTATNDKNGIELRFTLGDDADASDTVAAINIDPDSSTNDADTFVGIRSESFTAGTENATFIEVFGTGWDEFLSFNNLTVLDGSNNLTVNDATIQGALVQATGTIAADDVTPDVSGGNVFTTSANTGATAITDLDNPTVGQIVRIIGGSNTNSSTIADSGNFNLSAAWTASLDDVLTLFVQADNDYIEISRSNN